MGDYQSLTGKYWTPVHPSHSTPHKWREKNIEKCSKFIVERHRLNKRLRYNYRTVGHFPSPQSYQHITKVLLHHFVLPNILCLAIKKKLKNIQKCKKTRLEETKQASEPDMAGALELSGWEYKMTIINMPRALMDTVDSMWEQMAMWAEMWKP